MLLALCHHQFDGCCAPGHMATAGSTHPNCACSCAVMVRQACTYPGVTHHIQHPSYLMLNDSF